MVTGHPNTGYLVVTATGSHSPWLTALGIVWLIVILSWVLLFAVMIGLGATLTVARVRGRRQRLRTAAAPVAAPLDSGVGARLDALRHADPDFDEQVLLEAAQMACLLVFAATSTGDDAPLSQLAAQEFWSTPFGRYVRIAARDRRRERARAAKDGSASVPRSWVPLDYLASVPELVDVQLRPEQRVCVRVAMSELMAIVRPDAAFLANAGAARSLVSVAASVGGAMAASRRADRPLSGSCQPDLHRLRRDLPLRVRRRLLPLRGRTPVALGALAAGPEHTRGIVRGSRGVIPAGQHGAAGRSRRGRRPPRPPRSGSSRPRPWEC